MFIKVFAIVLLAALGASEPQFYRPFAYQRRFPQPLPVVRRIVPQPLIAARTYSVGPQIPILRQDSDIRPDGSYTYAYETGNGIAAQQSGSQRAIGPNFGNVAQGSYSYTSPEGEQVQISYVADENGYQASGTHVPEVPAAIQRAISYNAAHPQTVYRQFK